MVKIIRKFISSLILFCLAFVLFLGIGFANPVMAEGGSLFFIPGSESFSVGSNFSVDLKVDTADIPINAAESPIQFPIDKLEVLNISKENSIFSIWPKEPTFSNVTGEISFVGGLPHPGFNGVGNVFTITFGAKKEGEVHLTFESECKVLADDGKGTNILTFIKEAKYYIYQPETIKKEVEFNSSKIFSFTHPNSEEWYSNNNPRFQWDLTSTIEGVSFVFDKNPNTIPDTISEGLIQSKDYGKTPDGIWYFHLRFKDENGWGDTKHYKVQIDSKPPKPFEIIVDNEGNPTNPRPNLYFETIDDVSGISGYKIRIGEGNFLDLMLAQINPFTIPPQNPGNYKVIVRALDQAGNIVRSETFLNIDSLETPKINVWPEKYISGEETFYIEGTSLPNVGIIIFLKQGDKEIKRWQTLSNDKGEWFFSTKELIKPGIYDLLVMAQDKRGAVSNLSGASKIEATFSGLIRGNLMITFKNLILILISVLLIGIFLTLYYIYKSYQAKKILKKETREAKDSLMNNFSILEKEIEKKIELLDLKPGFNEKERQIYEDIKKSLQAAKESIGKEIKDIEKELE